MVVKLPAIQIMERNRDNNICLTGPVHTAFFLLGCFAIVEHVLDNLETPHEDIVEKVAATSLAILGFVMIKGSNSIRATVDHYCLVPSTHA